MACWLHNFHQIINSMINIRNHKFYLLHVYYVKIVYTAHLKAADQYDWYTLEANGRLEGTDNCKYPEFFRAANIKATKFFWQEHTAVQTAELDNSAPLADVSRRCVTWCLMPSLRTDSSKVYIVMVSLKIIEI